MSEVMCQQTQVARVVPRWEAWMARWPTAGALAAEELGAVLRAWVGLGYNRRAVRLREAAQLVAASGWPSDLRELPGVGPYTAAAVEAFALGRPVVPVDTNVARVCARTGLAPGTWAGDPDVGQALMELGATVCRARDAACGACPVAPWCTSAGRVEVPPRRAQAEGPRFEDTNRWVRGRVVAALAAGEGLPGDIPEPRLEAAVEGLLRDGLLRQDGQGLALG